MDESFYFIGLTIGSFAFLAGLLTGMFLARGPGPKPVKRYFPGEPDPQPYETPNWDLPGIESEDD